MVSVEAIRDETRCLICFGASMPLCAPRHATQADARFSALRKQAC